MKYGFGHLFLIPRFLPTNPLSASFHHCSSSPLFLQPSLHPLPPALPHYFSLAIYKESICILGGFTFYNSDSALLRQRPHLNCSKRLCVSLSVNICVRVCTCVLSYFRWSFALGPLPYPAQWWLNLSLCAYVCVCGIFVCVLDVSVHAMETENKYCVVRGRKIAAKAISYEAIKVMFSFFSNKLLNCLSLPCLSFFFSPSSTHYLSFLFLSYWTH